MNKQEQGASEMRAGAAQPAGSKNRRGMRKGIFLIPSALTLCNVLCGFFAVMNSLRAFQLLGEPEKATPLFDHAAQAIGIAFLLDGLDGRIARLTGATSEFGVELDSIADVISFGIAPAVLIWSWGYGTAPGTERLAWATSFIFLVCGALRLARFNVMARSPRFTVQGNTPKLDKRYFVGLPIPAAAGLLAAIVHFTPEPLSRLATAAPAAGQSPWPIRGLLALVWILALLMVSTFRYTSFKELGTRSNKPFVTLPLFAMVIIGILLNSQWVLLALATTYVLHGPALKLFNLLTRSRLTPTAGESSAHTSL
ncbi:MAG: CDP-alcohol phosphatidyltransferase family protein [Blastocatellia bacterium]